MQIYIDKGIHVLIHVYDVQKIDVPLKCSRAVHGEATSHVFHPHLAPPPWSCVRESPAEMKTKYLKYFIPASLAVSPENWNQKEIIMEIQNLPFCIYFLSF